MPDAGSYWYHPRQQQRRAGAWIGGAADH
ncbi:hypothetical protein QZH47_16075 [Pseudomonas corrugata]